MALSCGVNRKRVSYWYQSLTGFAKLLVTTNFQFEKTST
jgi:hypothetical protein